MPRAGIAAKDCLEQVDNLYMHYATLAGTMHS